MFSLVYEIISSNAVSAVLSFLLLCDLNVTVIHLYCCEFKALCLNIRCFLKMDSNIHGLEKNSWRISSWAFFSSFLINVNSFKHFVSIDDERIGKDGFDLFERLKQLQH